MSHSLDASRATEPYFYRAPWPEAELAKKDIKIKEYQLAGVEYCLGRDHALIGDAPGLGKTAQGVLISNAIGAQSTLVVCPASLRYNWEREIWMWSILPNVSTYPIGASKDGVSTKAQYVIVSYDLLRNDAIHAALMDRTWDHVILDEAHYLKDPKGNKRTKAVCGWHERSDYHPGLADVAGRITLLSGTILPNQPIECYNAVRLLDWDAIDQMSLEEFRNAYYAEGGGMVMGPVVKERDDGTPYTVRELHWSYSVRNVPVNLEDLQRRLRSRVMVRRTRDQVLHELPPMRWHPFPLAIDASIRKALAHPGWKMAEKLYELDARAFDTGVPVDGAISTARRLLGEAAAPAIAAYIEDLLHSGVEKLVVSAWHNDVLDYLRGRLAKYGLVFMGHSTSMKKRQDAVDEFQFRDKVRIILGQMQVLQLGWTLTAAQDVVNAEPSWTPGENDQLLYRISRMGQKGSYTLGHVPLPPGTLAEKIFGTAITKDISIFKALDAPL